MFLFWRISFLKLTLVTNNKNYLVILIWWTNMCLKDKTKANLSTLDADVLTYDMQIHLTLKMKT